MKLRGAIGIFVTGERLLREPGLWDRLVRRFGGEPDLRTDRVRAAVEATALVDGVQHAFRRLGVVNAISLIVDDQVLFQDRDGRSDDLGDLVLAFHDNAGVFGKEFSNLRLAAEHAEAGLHLVLELVASGVHPADEPAARLAIGGRLAAFEPRRGEDAEAYQRRVEPLARDTAALTVAQRQFESLVDRVADALRAALPEASVVVESAQAAVERPSRRTRPAPTRPGGRGYDPHDAWYPNPMEPVLSMLMWSSVMSMMMPPHTVVVDHHGDAIGTADAAASGDDNSDGTADGDHGDSGGDGGDFDGGDFGDI